MNIHEQVAHQELVEGAEAVGRGEITDVERHVQSQVEMLDRLGKAAIVSAKLHGECLRCKASIPIGGRPIALGTSALCEPCGEYAKQLVLDRLAARREK